MKLKGKNRKTRITLTTGDSVDTVLSMSQIEYLVGNTQHNIVRTMTIDDSGNARSELLNVMAFVRVQDLESYTT